MPSSEMEGERPGSAEADFIIGDRVWVGGAKPGYIQYLGEVQFSSGDDWAGVVLDDRSGKNDGSVAGVRYFQCEPGRGVFARLARLTRYPSVSAPATPSPPPPRCLSPGPARRTPSPGGQPLREGDRVLVGAGPPRPGVLRYLGPTEFAAGEWAGVELDEPLGRNDGSVAGKRYFRCAPLHGLFSPSHRVARLHDRRAEERRLWQLLEAAEAEKADLAARLEEQKRAVEELEFRAEEERVRREELEATLQALSEGGPRNDSRSEEGDAGKADENRRDESGHEELKSERDALEQQVSFLSSVIVDMQRKNDDLRARLEAGLLLRSESDF